MIWLQQNYSVVASSIVINAAENQKSVFSCRFGEGGTFTRHFLCLLWPAWWDLLLCWQQTPIAQQERAPACQGWLGPAAAQGHGQGHSWQTWIFAHHSIVAISCNFPDPSSWSWNFIFPSVFFCAPCYIICSFWFSCPGRFLAHISSECTAVSLCPHASLFFQSCLQSPWTWLLLTWQSWWTGCWALHSEVMGHGWAGHSCQPNSAGEQALQVLAGEAVNMCCQPLDLLLGACYLPAFIMQMSVCPRELGN